MKGIILAGGLGSRLLPTTLSVSKHLIPIYDKPMIYYPLSVLMLADIRDVLIISTSNDIERFRNLLGNGEAYGMNLNYAAQEEAKGVPDAFNVGKAFINHSNVALILGDNFFYGQGFVEKLKKSKGNLSGATLFGYQMKNPEDFGVMELGGQQQVLSIKEKPKNPKSKWVATGLYFYDDSVGERVKDLKVSERGELEITDLNNTYLRENKLKAELLGRGFSWLDTGTPDNIVQASEFVKIIEQRQGLKIACLEEIAFEKKWISSEQIYSRLSLFKNSSYGEYLKNLI